MGTREEIVSAMRAALEPLDWVNAMWLAGSDATGTSDELSDIDVLVDVADGRVGDAFSAIQSALSAVSPIEQHYALPAPTWHGHAQRFYRLRDCPEYLMVDLVIMERGSEAPRFNEVEIHGRPIIVFDKLDVVTAAALDRGGHREAMRKRFATQKARFYLFRHLAAKEVRRDNPLDALFRYHSFVLTPLISVLRARYAPFFHDFGLRYFKRHLPEEVCERLTRLAFVGDPDQLDTKIDEAIRWAEDEFATLDIDAVEL